MTITLRRALTIVAAITIAAVGLVACGDDDGGSSDVPNLDGKWALDSTSLDPAIGSQITDETRPTIEFAGTAVTGFNGCNSYNTTVTYDAEDMTFGPISQTLLACQEPATSIESAYTAALESVEFYEKTGTTLRLRNGDSQVVLTFGAV